MTESSHSLTVVVTRAVGDSDTFIDALYKRGAHVLHIPCISFVPHIPATWETMVKDLFSSKFSWLVCTSQHGVRFLKEALKGRILLSDTVSVAVVGPKTERVWKEVFGFPPSLVAKNAYAEGLVQDLLATASPQDIAASMLIVTPCQGRQVIEEELKAKKVNVVVAHLYETLSRVPSKEEGEKILALEKESSCVAFFSPSAVSAFSQRLKVESLPLHYAAFGETTASALAERKVTVKIKGNARDEVIFAHQIADAILK